MTRFDSKLNYVRRIYPHISLHFGCNRVCNLHVDPSRYNRVKLEPYECGIEPTTDARDRYSVRYYLVAMLFVIFDVETVFLFPWAVIMDELALFGLIEMLVFLFILVVGYAYAWRKGALDWT